ncbi:MAG: DNA polymerase Y family protein [Candidatus Zixiibacteriota bacterium]|nr:MAG: DNA polymerase Y family protein [candidate division Zixibacteria bacterium]
MTKDRIACVTVPNFPIAICLRVDQPLQDKPVALVEVDSGSPRISDSSPILAVSDIAANTGVTCSMTVAQAKSYCPDLVVKVRDTKREKAASAKLRDLLFTASPLIEETDPGCFFLDASGLNWLYKNENKLALKLVSLITPLRLPVQVGIANNKFVAKAAAQTSPIDSFTVVPAKTEPRFLNSLTIDYLPFSDDTREKLLALGLKTIGQVAAFPSNEMTARFGQEGAVISRLSRGDDTNFFLPEMAHVKISARVSLFEPLQSTQAIIAHVEKTLTKLLEKLNRTDRGCREVDIKLHLETNGQMRTSAAHNTWQKSEQSLHLALKQVVGTPHKFIGRLVNQLNSYRLPAGVMDITITIPEVLPLVSSQMELMRASGSFGQMGTSAAHKFSDNARINSELRQVRLMFPAIHNAVIPDNNFGFYPVDQKNKSSKADKTGDACCQYSLNPIAGLRLVSPAQKASVVTGRKKLRQLRLNNHTKPIIGQNGPWELSGEWWKYGFDRLYYEVQTTDHQFYLLYFDRQASDWYVQGVFD